MVLDDDDYLIDERFVERLRALCQERPVDVVVVQMDVCGTLLPDRWPLQQDHVAVSCVIVSAEVWANHARDFGERYAGDYDYIRAILDCPARHSVAQTALVAARVDRVSRGARA